jgi:hypothetical protein
VRAEYLDDELPDRRLDIVSLPSMNVVVEWLTILLRIREVSNLGPEIGIPDQGFSWFSLVPPGEC